MFKHFQNYHFLKLFLHDPILCGASNVHYLLTFFSFLTILIVSVVPTCRIVRLFRGIWTSFVDHLCYSSLVFVMLSSLFIAVLYHLQRKDWPLSSCLWCFFLFFVTFLCGIQGQVWYSIVSVPGRCHLFYFFKCPISEKGSHVSLLVPCGHLLEKGWSLGSCLWCLIVTVSFSHWCHGSGVVLDCIYSWYLPSF